VSPLPFTAHVTTGPTLTVLVPVLNPSGVYTLHSFNSLFHQHWSAPSLSITHFWCPDIDPLEALVMLAGVVLELLVSTIAFGVVFSLVSALDSSFLVFFCFFLVSFASDSFSVVSVSALDSSFLLFFLVFFCFFLVSFASDSFSVLSAVAVSSAD
jgi:hypothetical protein